MKNIESVKSTKDKLVTLHVSVKYKGTKVEGVKSRNFIEKKLEKIEEIDRDINSYLGDSVKFYYMPLFENFGYLDIPSIIGSIWFRAVLFAISLIPNISFFIDLNL
ncbi:MAG: hypothetical protein GWN33_08740 [Gammaproteobacteria bacterium]|nr:hypothetical protein [Gammaproteobacteria bacterium]